MPDSEDNRFIFGIIIGSTCTFYSFIAFLASVFFLIFENGSYEVMTIFLASTLISAVFVFAIEKRVPILIIPWFLFCLVVIYFSIGFMWLLYPFLYHDGQLSVNKSTLTIFLICVGIIAIELVVTLYSFWLFFKIVKENGLQRIPSSVNETAYLTEMPEKSAV